MDCGPLRNFNGLESLDLYMFSSRIPLTTVAHAHATRACITETLVADIRVHDQNLTISLVGRGNTKNEFSRSAKRMFLRALHGLNWLLSTCITRTIDLFARTTPVPPLSQTLLHPGRRSRAARLAGSTLGSPRRSSGFSRRIHLRSSRSILRSPRIGRQPSSF